MSERHWNVTSPAWPEVEPILDDGSGPTEWGHEVVSVAATTRRKAIVAGVKAMKHWPKYQRRDNMSPFTGVTAAPAMCEHGFCWCEIHPDPHPEQGDYCEECIKEDNE